MDRKGFKIGDKVKLKNPKQWSVGGAGLIVGFDGYIRVSWEKGSINVKSNFPHLVKEIEHVVKVGEQLMFAFMRTSD